MRRTLIAGVTSVLVLYVAAAEPPTDGGRASRDESFTPVPGDTKTFYDESDKITTKGHPGFENQVSFANLRYDVVYMRTRLRNGEILSVRIPKGHTFIVSTHGEPAICMCWHNVKPVYQCRYPDPVAVPASAQFQFGLVAGFQRCSSGF
jgi:hypothetical protein